MTPAEKALELYNKYLPYVNDYSYPEQGAKELCMIAVNELCILAAFFDKKIVDYLEEVKKEIEKL
jgi:hypothetical protein